MIGWIQALALSALGITIIIGTVEVIKKHLELKHEREIKKMEQAHETMQADNK